MSILSRFGLLTIIAATCVLPPASAHAQSEEVASLWSDFNHYVLIARPDLAANAGQALLDRTNPGQLLDIVEASDYTDYSRTLDRASRMEGVSELAATVAETIERARIERSRDPQRIERNIDLLDEGERPRINATNRLTAAGPYAAPALLDVLLDPDQEDMHPYVIDAMVQIGRPLAAPLAEALSGLNPAQTAQIARVLAEIGYPLPLPHLKRKLESGELNPQATEIVQTAVDRLMSNAKVPADADAAQLFLVLGLDQYDAQTDGRDLPGLDEANSTGLVWVYTKASGLVPIEVPRAIFGDVLAMKSAKAALDLDDSLDQALSLWLTANLRRENNLPQGQTDPSYPSQMKSPLWYATVAGPIRQTDILATALTSGDADLALDAIEALSRSAGTATLTSASGPLGALQKALAYPDRRVRFAAAFTLAAAKPAAEFPGSHRVVAVLCEAVRQSDTRYAVLLAADQDTRNQLTSTLDGLGYTTIAAAGLDGVYEPLARTPGADLLVVAGGPDRVEAVLSDVQNDYKLGSVPLIAVASASERIEINRRLPDSAMVYTTDRAGIAGTIDTALQTLAGDPITEQEAAQYATTALGYLHDAAVASSAVYDLADAEPVLIEALGDPREGIVVDTARVLALIDTPASQRAIARAALELTRATPVRIALLEELAADARLYGNLLTADGQANIQSLLNEADGQLAEATAQAYGALSLPTQKATEAILK